MRSKRQRCDTDDGDDETPRNKDFYICQQASGSSKRKAKEEMPTNLLWAPTRLRSDTAEVAAALAKTDNQRKYDIEKLKNMGNYSRNIQVLSSGKGELIIARRSNKVNIVFPLTGSLTPIQHW